MSQDSLFNSIGGGDSPMFLASNPSAPLDTSPLGYYVQQKEKAQGLLAQKIANDMPKFDAFDDKAIGDPGDAQYTKRQIEQRRMKIMQGIKNAGGIPTVYINSEEGKRDLSQLNNDVWNYRAAKNNNENRTLADKKIDDLQIGSQIRLDPRTGKPEINNEGTGFKRYGDWTKDEAMTPKEQAPGVLSQKDFAVIDTRPKVFTDEVDEIAKNSKSTDWSSAAPIPMGVDANGNPTFVGTQAGDYAYSVIANSEAGGHSNKEQLKAAANTLYSDLSMPAKLALKTQLYEKMEKGQYTGFTNFSTGKEDQVDWNKFNKDDSYAENVMQGYMYDRINQRLKPYESTGSKSKTSLDSLGRIGGGGKLDKDLNISMIGAIRGGALDDMAQTQTNSYQFFDKKGDSKFSIGSYDTKVWSGIGVQNQLGFLNEEANKGNLKLNASHIIFGNKTTDLTNEAPELKDLSIINVNPYISTEKPVIKEGNSYRDLTNAERLKYDALAKKDPKSYTKEDQYLAQSVHREKYLSVNVDLGDDPWFGGNSKYLTMLKGYNKKGEEQSAVDPGFSTEHFGQDVHFDDKLGTWVATVKMPLTDMDEAYGTNPQAQSYWNEATNRDIQDVQKYKQMQQDRNANVNFADSFSTDDFK